VCVCVCVCVCVGGGRGVRARAHAGDNMLSPFRYRSLVEVAVLLVSSPPRKPEGVLLADAAGGESRKG